MDQVDKKILEELQKNGRMSNVELAKKCNLAPSSMLARVRRLDKGEGGKGIITSYRAIISPKAVGYNVQALIMVNLDQHQLKSIASFEESITSIPEVKTGYRVTGQYDYVLHAVLRDIDHLDEFVKTKLASIPGMGRQETFIIFSSVKEDEGLSLDYVKC